MIIDSIEPALFLFADKLPCLGFFLLLFLSHRAWKPGGTAQLFFFSPLVFWSPTWKEFLLFEDFIVSLEAYCECLGALGSIVFFFLHHLLDPWIMIDMGNAFWDVLFPTGGTNGVWKGLHWAFLSQAGGGVAGLGVWRRQLAGPRLLVEIGIISGLVGLGAGQIG